MLTVHYHVTGQDEPLVRYSYHAPRVGDRVELVERGEEDQHHTGDIVGVTWTEEILRVEVLSDDPA